MFQHIRTQWIGESSWLHGIIICHHASIVIRKLAGTSFASNIQNFLASCVAFACSAQATALHLLMILETRLRRASVIGLRIWRRVSS